MTARTLAGTLGDGGKEQVLLWAIIGSDSPLSACIQLQLYDRTQLKPTDCGEPSRELYMANESIPQLWLVRLAQVGVAEGRLARVPNVKEDR